MKTTKFNLYSTITTLVLLVLLALVATVLNSCTKEEYIENMPLVIFYNEAADFIEKDSIVIDVFTGIKDVYSTPLDWVNIPQPIIDTTEVDTIEPCIPELHLTPLFVTGFMEIHETVTTDIEVWVYPHHATATTGGQIPGILDSLLKVYDPTLLYLVYQSDTDWRRMAFIAEGTLDKEHFHGEVFLRFNGHNSGWGFGVTPQAFLFAGSLTFDEYMAAILVYPSVNYFNFRETHWTQDEYIKAALAINECKIGRYWADFRFNPIQIPDSIIVMYENAGWEKVLH
jgi:hypothetical protein